MDKPLFRFKTKDEFITEFGHNWRLRTEVYWVVSMDNLLGIDIPVKNNLRFMELWMRVFSYAYFYENGETFFISKDMIVPITNNTIL